jgi:hypothetical protein
VVYTCQRGSDAIRIVVAGELAQEERNALLHLFSAAPAQVEYGAEHCRPLSPATSSIINQLFGAYQQEGLHMPYTLEDFKRDYIREGLQKMTADEIAEQLTLEQRLTGLLPEQLLAALSDQQIEAYLKGRQNKSANSKKKKPKTGR